MYQPLFPRRQPLAEGIAAAAAVATAIVIAAAPLVTTSAASTTCGVAAATAAATTVEFITATIAGATTIATNIAAAKCPLRDSHRCDQHEVAARQDLDSRQFCPKAHYFRASPLH